mgnify:CR=1 FL=1
MSDFESKLNRIALDIAEIKGSVNVLAAQYQHTSEQIKKVEGRQWGLTLLVLSSLGTALLSILLARSEKISRALSAIMTTMAN